MNPLQKLLISNRGAGQFRCEAGKDEATIYLYDVIVSDDYWGGVSAQNFVKELNALDAPVIHLRINSPGGDVFAGRAMAQAIREHNSKVIAHVDGYAASAASYVALAGDEVHMAEGGFFMIHKAWTIAFGNSDDLMDTAALLEKIDNSLISTYAKETGQDEEQIGKWMAEETWFNADEAIEYGFATHKSEDSAQASAWDLSAYSKAPEAEKPDEKSVVTPESTTSNTDHLMRRLRLVALNA